MLAWRFQSASFRTSSSKVLFLSLLPTLVFVGHWSLRLDIPGTDYYLGAPTTASAAERHHHHGSSEEQSGHDHEQHCHANAATCADAAAVPTAPVAHLADGLATLGAESPWRKIAAEARSLTGWTSAPTSPPPRPARAA